MFFIEKISFFERKKSVFIVLGTVVLSCNDPNVIGLEIHPESDKITINNDSIDHFSISTISEDSLRSDESLNLLEVFLFPYILQDLNQKKNSKLRVVN